MSDGLNGDWNIDRCERTFLFVRCRHNFDRSLVLIIGYQCNLVTGHDPFYVKKELPQCLFYLKGTTDPQCYFMKKGAFIHGRALFHL